MSYKDLAEAILKAPHTYIIGNGGSYANAVHFCNDLLACRVKAHILDPATLTASANDFGYETVFARWLDTVGEAGDLLIALSGSGKSPNILLALATASKKGMEVWPVFGAARGQGMQEAEESQLVLAHDVMRYIHARLP